MAERAQPTRVEVHVPVETEWFLRVQVQLYASGSRKEVPGVADGVDRTDGLSIVLVLPRPSTIGGAQIVDSDLEVAPSFSSIQGAEIPAELDEQSTSMMDRVRRWLGIAFASLARAISRNIASEVVKWILGSST